MFFSREKTPFTSRVSTRTSLAIEANIWKHFSILFCASALFSTMNEISLGKFPHVSWIIFSFSLTRFVILLFFYLNEMLILLFLALFNSFLKHHAFKPFNFFFNLAFLIAHRVLSFILTKFGRIFLLFLLTWIIFMWENGVVCLTKNIIHVFI